MTILAKALAVKTTKTLPMATKPAITDTIKIKVIQPMPTARVDTLETMAVTTAILRAKTMATTADTISMVDKARTDTVSN